MSETTLDSIEDAVAAIAAGEMIVVVDDEDRENEGDLIMTANKATAEQVAFMIRHTSGILCTPLENDRARALNLTPMVHENNAPLSTAFTVSVDYKHGLTTGISAENRSSTIQALANSNVGVDDFVRPGHVFPLISKKGGVLTRSGHTEAAIDLARLAGCPLVGLLAEVVNDDGTVKRLAELLIFAQTHHLKIISIADLIAYRQRRETLVEVAETLEVQTDIGPAQGFIYRTHFDHLEHVALVFGTIDNQSPVLTRIHRQRTLDDTFGSQGGHSKNLVNAALAKIAQEGSGFFLYLSQEGHTNLSEEVTSETKRMAQWKEIGVGAQILRDRGITRIKLLSGRDRSYIGLRGFDIEIVKNEAIDAEG